MAGARFSKLRFEVRSVDAGTRVAPVSRHGLHNLDEPSDGGAERPGRRGKAVIASGAVGASGELRLEVRNGSGGAGSFLECLRWKLKPKEKERGAVRCEGLHPVPCLWVLLIRPGEDVVCSAELCELLGLPSCLGPRALGLRALGLRALC